MKSIFFLLIFSFSLFAVDVSNFDIKGIKLGMSKKEVLNKMPCKKPIMKNPWSSVPAEWLGDGFDFICKYTEKNNEEIFTISLDYDGIVISINRVINFSYKTNEKNLKTKLILRYGKADKSYENFIGWGKIDKQYFNAYFHNRGKKLILSLHDEKQTRIYNQLIYKKTDEYELKKSKEASSIDF